MNKSDLVDMISEKTGLTKVDSGKAIDAFIASVTEGLAKGDSLSLVGFGSFSVKKRAARIGRNPKTGDPVNIAAANIPGFKAGKGLKEAVNK